MKLYNTKVAYNFDTSRNPHLSDHRYFGNAMTALSVIPWGKATLELRVQYCGDVMVFLKNLASYEEM